MTTAQTRYERGRGAIFCRWLSHNWRAQLDPISAKPIRFCLRCGEVVAR